MTHDLKPHIFRFWRFPIFAIGVIVPDMDDTKIFE
jgi:hypothetical protein